MNIPLSSVSKELPNILIIIAEGVEPSFLSPYGDSTVRLPNLERLANEGIVYDQMFSTYAVCAPSRTALITGMYPSGIGANHQRTSEANRTIPYLSDYESVPPPEVKCFPEYLRKAEYYCTNQGQTDYQFKVPFTTWNENGKKATWENRGDNQPFFSIVNVNVTHESQLWIRQEKPLRLDIEQVKIPPYFSGNNRVIKEQVARMYDNNLSMDEKLGEIFEKLRVDELLNNTVIIFTCDHNGPFPWYKREVYDRGTHVPFIIRFPDGYLAGTKDSELHSLVDIAPSVLSLVGLAIPEHMQGQAFLGKSKADNPRTYVYTGRDRMDEQIDFIRSVRDKNYRYVRNYIPDITYYHPNEYRMNMPMMREILRLKEADSLNKPLRNWFSVKVPEELYDVINDPYELDNIAKKPEYDDVLKRMRRALDSWQRRIGDKGFMQEMELIKLMWPNGKQPETSSPEIRAIRDENNNTIVKLSCDTEGASIGYQLPSDPKGSWRLYTEPFVLPKNEGFHSKAIRIGYKESKKIIYE